MFHGVPRPVSNAAGHWVWLDTKLTPILSADGSTVTEIIALSRDVTDQVAREAQLAAARADLKSDVLKDIEKQKHLLDSYRGNTAISEAALDGIVAQLDRCFTSLNTQAGKTGQPLTENDWLMAIRSRAGIPGGTCGFDLPSYAAWQHRPAVERQRALEGWVSALAPLAESIFLLLKLLRDSGIAQKVAAERGQLQQNLPQGRTFQLLRLRIDPALGLVPEISGNRLMVSVRLMRHEADGKLHASGEDTGFELTLCS